MTAWGRKVRGRVQVRVSGRKRISEVATLAKHIVMDSVVRNTSVCEGEREREASMIERVVRKRSLGMAERATRGSQVTNTGRETWCRHEESG